jgi:hypothetical protein
MLEQQRLLMGRRAPLYGSSGPRDLAEAFDAN